MALRTRKFDQYVQDFIENNDMPVIVNLGCGLDTRFERVDNGKTEWFDLDFLEVIDPRKQFFTESDRGKSTLMEAIAYQCDFNTAGGGRKNYYEVPSSEAALGDFIKPYIFTHHL